MSPGLKQGAQSKTGTDSSTSKVGEGKPNKRKNGYNKAGLLSRLFFCWVDPLIWLGFRKKRIKQEDLYGTPNYATAEWLQEKFDKHWQSELARQSKGKEPRLWVPMFHLLWSRLLGQFFVSSVMITLTTVQAVALGMLSEYFVSTKTPESTTNAYLLAGAIALTGYMTTLSRTWEFELGLETGARIRIAVTCLILRNSIKLHLQTLKKVSVGKIISLSTTDVHRFDQAFLCLHYLLLAPLHTIVVLLLLWFYIGLGPSCLPGLLLLLLQLPLQYFLSSIYMYLRLKAAQYTDERIKVTNQFISGIRVIKMYGWEYAFKKLVAGIRKMETVLIFLANLFRAVNSANLSFSTALVYFLIFVTYALGTGNPITSRMVFTTMPLITYVRMLTFYYIVEAVLGVREIKVATRRIQEFLLKGQSDRLQIKNYSHDPLLTPDLGIGPHPCNDMGNSQPQKLALSKRMSAHVKVNNLSAAWKLGEGGTEAEPTLQNINFECNMANRMLAIVGPVGAGKSSILYCLLGELEPLSGDVAVVGSLGYAAQEPWLFNGSVRTNILFGLEYDDEWYQKVIDACCLREDIEQLSQGDMTLVGERGVSLSGGQKARVTLARAVYRKADVYLLDDPLSAVDAAVGRLLFENCLCGLLRDSIVVLVTHQLQYAKMADNMLVISQGQPIAYGSFEEILQRSGEDSEVDAVLNKMLANLMKDTEKSPTAEEPTKVEEERNGAPRTKVLPDGGTSTDEPETAGSNTTPEEDKERGSISLWTYLRYFREGAWSIFVCLLALLFLLTQASLVGTDTYLSMWSTTSKDCEGPNSTGLLCNLTVNQIVEVFSGLVSGTILLSIARAILFYFLCVNAARNLHNKMFGALLRAPVRFFDTNPIGRVLTRFSKDLFFLDIVLPRQFFDLLDQLLQVVAILIVAGVANVYMLIPGAAVTLALLTLRYYYVAPAIELRRLEAVARSPVYSHISDSLQGLITIRACKREVPSIEYFHNVMDENTKGWMFYINANRWFALRSDLLATTYTAVLALASIPMVDLEVLDPSLISLSLVYALSLAEAFRRSVRNSTDVEGMMVSVERVIAYTKLKPEAPLETPPGREKPPGGWPQFGNIHVHEMKFRYAQDTPYILKGISVDIKPGEKVGVVGRTGAGKSSLMQALFRMAEPEGNIHIDSVNITEVGLHTLRKKLSIIPQDPVIFSGSVRYNLDPFDEYSDDAIWIALEQVQLKAVVADLPGGLNASITEGGSNFSMGQRQLMCLARALLKRNRILVIDEATANVDRVTDAIIQQTIRKEFADCTTLTIAHRLNTIMDSDRIMVLSAGRIVEFDTPHTLLQNRDSHFSQLVEQVNPRESWQLRQTAANHYRVMPNAEGDTIGSGYN